MNHSRGLSAEAEDLTNAIFHSGTDTRNWQSVQLVQQPNGWLFVWRSLSAIDRWIGDIDCPCHEVMSVCAILRLLASKAWFQKIYNRPPPFRLRDGNLRCFRKYWPALVSYICRIFLCHIRKKVAWWDTSSQVPRMLLKRNRLFSSDDVTPRYDRLWGGQVSFKCKSLKTKVIQNHCHYHKVFFFFSLICCSYITTTEYWYYCFDGLYVSIMHL